MWDTFWQAADMSNSPERTKTVRVATTTDSMEQAQVGADGDYARGKDDTVIETLLQRAEPSADGTTEHNQPKVWINNKLVKPAGDRHLRDHFEGVSPEQRLANRQNYIKQREDAPALLPNFEETAYDDSVELPGDALEMIADGGLPNPAVVQHYLGEHKEVAAGMIGLSRKQVQSRMKELSAQLMANPAEMSLDKLPYDQYCLIRERQLKAHRR